MTSIQPLNGVYGILPEKKNDPKYKPKLVYFEFYFSDFVLAWVITHYSVLMGYLKCVN